MIEFVTYEFVTYGFRASRACQVMFLFLFTYIIEFVINDRVRDT